MRTAGLAVIALCLTGCASIFAGGPIRIPVTSEPSGADVLVNGNHAGVTPCVVVVERKPEVAYVRVETVGRESETRALLPRTSAWLLLDVLLILPLVGDVALGNVSGYDTDPIHANLRDPLAH